MERYLSLALYPQLASGINVPLGYTLIDAEKLTIKKKGKEHFG